MGLQSSIYEVDGEQELAVWNEGEESEAMTFVVVNGKICRKGEVSEVVEPEAKEIGKNSIKFEVKQSLTGRHK